jgi:hypothetical protein
VAVDCGALGDEFRVNDSSDVEENDQHRLDARFLESYSSSTNSAGRSPLHALSFRLRVILKTPTVVARHDSLQNVRVVFNKFNEITTTFDYFLFLLRGSRCAAQKANKSLVSINNFSKCREPFIY